MRPHGNKQIRDHSFKHNIGNLISANSSTTFQMLGFCIILKHQDCSDMNPKCSTYVVFSQNEQREWELPCWTINMHWSKVIENVVSR